MSCRDNSGQFLEDWNAIDMMYTSLRGAYNRHVSDHSWIYVYWRGVAPVQCFSFQVHQMWEKVLHGFD